MTYRLSDQTPPEPTRVTDIVVERFAHVYEIDPQFMTRHVPQQAIPAWDTRRMVDSRMEYLYWVQDHFADMRVSGDELLREIEAEEAEG